MRQKEVEEKEQFLPTHADPPLIQDALKDAATRFCWHHLTNIATNFEAGGALKDFIDSEQLSDNRVWLVVASPGL